MAYWLLYHVRHIGEGRSRPWHKKRNQGKPAGPGEVKSLFATKIFPLPGSPSRPPIMRKKSQGRKLGTRFLKTRQKKSGQKTQRTAKSSLTNTVFDKIFDKTVVAGLHHVSKVQSFRTMNSHE